MTKELLFAVDPSIKAMGFAVFFSYAAKRQLKHSAVIHPPNKAKSLGWVERLDLMVSQLTDLMDYWIDHYDVEPTIITVAIELPDYRTEAAANSGSIEKLVACVFTIRAICQARGYTPLLFPVRVWKGNVPKSVTQRRIIRDWGWTGTDHNEADAVGIGSFAIANRSRGLK